MCQLISPVDTLEADCDFLLNYHESCLSSKNWNMIDNESCSSLENSNTIIYKNHGIMSQFQKLEHDSERVVSQFGELEHNHLTKSQNHVSVPKTGTRLK